MHDVRTMPVNHTISGRDLVSDEAALDRICHRHHVRRLAMFGSAVRGEQKPDSDVDLLIEYEQGYTPTLLDVAALGEELSPLFDGRYVDLVMPRNLHWYIRDAVLASARVIYEG